MKKQLLIAMMACGAVLFGCASQEVDKVEEPKTEQKVEVQKPSKVTYNDMVEAIQWEMVEDEYGDTTVTGKFTNTSDKEIEYIEIEYKFILDGVTVDSSWTNAINIEPGEAIKIEILTFEQFDTMQVKDSEAKDWITVGTAVNTESIVNEEQQEQVIEEQKEQVDVVIYEYNGTLKEYIADVLEAGVTESDVNGVVEQMFAIAMCSTMDNKEHILFDKDGNVIYSYMNGEMVQDNVSVYLEK